MNDWAIGVRVLLVEEDPLTREVLSAALSDTGFEVHAEPDGSRVHRLLATFRPEIAILDVELANGVHGITLARRLLRVEEVPVLFLVGASDIEEVLSGLDVGAADYVVKPFMMTEVLARLQAVLRRSRRPGRNVLEAGNLMIDLDGHRAVRAGREIDLTNREFTVLVALARHPGIVQSKAQLLSDVWGLDHHDPNVVEVHVSAVRRKLEEHGTRLVHTVRGIGYVLRA